MSPTDPNKPCTRACGGGGLKTNGLFWRKEDFPEDTTRTLMKMKNPATVLSMLWASSWAEETKLRDGPGSLGDHGTKQGRRGSFSL